VAQVAAARFGMDEESASFAFPWTQHFIMRLGLTPETFFRDLLA
jgi:hypothetical protein